MIHPNPQMRPAFSGSRRKRFTIEQIKSEG
jgi:hypothetical protein